MSHPSKLLDSYLKKFKVTSRCGFDLDLSFFLLFLYRSCVFHSLSSVYDLL